MGILLILFPAVILVGVLAGSIAIYLNDRNQRNGKGRSIAIYILGILLAGVTAWFFAIAAAPAFCHLFPGEACSSVAGGIGFPALFGFCVATFIYFWGQRGKTP
jgi:uncharacterized membrane protein YeaQ/YmgE (transglycosylase-associated protein family)